MKQNRFKLFTSFTLLLLAIVAVSSCKKYAYNENENFTHCYCVIFISQGVEYREDVRMHTSSERYAKGTCNKIQKEKGARYGYQNVECDIK